MCNLDKIFVVSPEYYLRARDSRDRYAGTRNKRMARRATELFEQVRDAAMRTIPDITVYKQFIHRIDGYYSVNFHTSSEPYEHGEIYTARNRIHGFYAYLRPRHFCMPTMRVHFKDVLAIGEENTDIVVIADKMMIMEIEARIGR